MIVTTYLMYTAYKASSRNAGINDYTILKISLQ